MKWFDKLVLISVIVFIISNPLTGQYVLTAIDWSFQQIFIYGGYVSLVTSVVIIVYIIINMVKNNKVNIPKKSKTKTQKYIET